MDGTAIRISSTLLGEPAKAATSEKHSQIALTTHLQTALIEGMDEIEIRREAATASNGDWVAGGT